MGISATMQCVASFFEDCKDSVFSVKEVFENIEKPFYFRDKSGKKDDSFSLNVSYRLVESTCELLSIRNKINKIIINDEILYHF